MKINDIENFNHGASLGNTGKIITFENMVSRKGFTKKMTCKQIIDKRKRVSQEDIYKKNI